MNSVETLDPARPQRGGYKVDVGRGERNGRVSSEWFNRPDDERFLSLDDLWASVKSRSTSPSLFVTPRPAGHRRLVTVGREGGDTTIALAGKGLRVLSARPHGH